MGCVPGAAAGTRSLGGCFPCERTAGLREGLWPAFKLGELLESFCGILKAPGLF